MQRSTPRQEVSFPSGGVTLAGYVYPAQNTGAPVGLAIIVHGLNSNADKMLPLITYYQERGWTCFAFDGTGAGASEGDSVRGLNQQRLDLEAAISYVGLAFFLFIFCFALRNDIVSILG